MSCGSKRAFFSPPGRATESPSQRARKDADLDPSPVSPRAGRAAGSAGKGKMPTALASDESRFQLCPVCQKHVTKVWFQSHVEEHFAQSEGGADTAAGPQQQQQQQQRQGRSGVARSKRTASVASAASAEPIAVVDSSEEEEHDEKGKEEGNGDLASSTANELETSVTAPSEADAGRPSAGSVAHSGFVSAASALPASTASTAASAPPAPPQSQLRPPTASGARPYVDMPRDVAPVFQGGSRSKAQTPLAERMRPRNLDEVVGHADIVGPKTLLRALLDSDQIPSMVFWGPPGCGKTTLAKIICRHTRAQFKQLSAVTAGLQEVRDVLKEARQQHKLTRRSTVLFIDEVHRFNKLQQDVFLPYVEDGTIVLIGATTENPSFELNSALLSRCRVFVLQKLTHGDIAAVLQRALDDTERGLGSLPVYARADTLLALATAADGDARVALNALEMAAHAAAQAGPRGRDGGGDETAAAAAQAPAAAPAPARGDMNPAGSSSPPPPSPPPPHTAPGRAEITLEQVRDALQRSHLVYDKKGDQHYDIISALHKSVRGSDVDASLYWLGRMLAGGEGPLYVARRVVRMAAEDIGLADPQALPLCVAAYQACHFIGMPECDCILAEAVAYLARAPKSVAVYKAFGRVKETIQKEGNPPVPLHLRNAPTGLMKSLGYGRDYLYPPDHDYQVQQDYLPPELKGRRFFYEDGRDPDTSEKPQGWQC